MIYHILNGDSLAHNFPEAHFEGEIIVAREALIDGNADAPELEAFWNMRADYLGITMAEYENQVVTEFNRILQAPENSEFNLWFEYDLFCQVNMWFVISLLHSIDLKKKVFAVYTTHLDRSSKYFWNGFGPAKTEDLITCYNNRILLNDADLEFGKNFWEAYKANNREDLKALSEVAPPSFPFVKEVIEAQLDRFPEDGSTGRPEKLIEYITANISTDFPTVFREFWNRESIYGFGDTQLKKLYDKVMSER